MNKHLRDLDVEIFDDIDESLTVDADVALCDYCGTNPPDDDAYPYCSLQCAIDAENDSQEDTES